MDDVPRKAQQRSIRLQTPRKTPRKTPRSGSLAMAAMNSSMKEHQIGPKWGGQGGDGQRLTEEKVSEISWIREQIWCCGRYERYIFQAQHIFGNVMFDIWTSSVLCVLLQIMDSGLHITVDSVVRACSFFKLCGVTGQLGNFSKPTCECVKVVSP